MNIFDNAYFGKVYRTRDGRKAIYFINCQCIVNGELVIHSYCSNGNYSVHGIECGLDIVSEWEEPINEEHLDDLAYDYNEERQPNYWWEDDGTDCVCEASEVREAFKAGYKKAINEQ